MCKSANFCPCRMGGVRRMSCGAVPRSTCPIVLANVPEIGRIHSLGLRRPWPVHVVIIGVLGARLGDAMSVRAPDKHDEKQGSDRGLHGFVSDICVVPSGPDSTGGTTNTSRSA